MELLEWARQHLVTTAPRDLRVWHWTHHSQLEGVRARMRAGESLRDFSEQALGRGLYLSGSAIDTIDKGDAVLTAIVPAGTSLLAVDADLFEFGVPEVFEHVLAREGWSWRATPSRGHIDRATARPAREVVPRLMDALGVGACVYIFGFHLALMAREGHCLRTDDIDAARSVADYVAAHPREAPTLAPRAHVTAWLRAHVRGWTP